MNNIFSTRLLCLIGLSSFTLAANTLPTGAQPFSSATSQAVSQTSFDPTSVRIEVGSGFNVVVDQPNLPEQLNLKPVNWEAQSLKQPLPGTVATSISGLQAQAGNTNSIAQGSPPLVSNPYARGTFVGVGGNFGLDTDSPLGESGGIVFSKIPISSNVSLRPSVIINGDAAFLVPFSYDFVIPGETPFQPKPFVPYAGAGLVVTTDEDDNVGFLFSAGLDWHLSERWLGNAQFNVGAIEDATDLSLMVGVAYKLFGN